MGFPLLRLLIVVGIVGAGLIARSGDARADADDERSGNDLRLTFVPGREFVYRVAMTKRVVQEGEKRPYRSETRFTLHAKTQSVADSEATFQYKFQRVEWSVSGSPADGSFDSQSRPNADEPPMFASARAMIGKPYLVVLGDRGQVFSVRGQGLRPDEKKSDPAAMQLVSEAQLRTLLVAKFAWLPSLEVSLRKPWSREEELHLGVLLLTRKNTVSIVSAGPDRLRLRSTIVVGDRPVEGLIQGETRLTGKVLSSKPGGAEIVFHRKLGMLESLAANVAFEMRVDSQPQTKKEKPRSLTQAMEATTEIRLLAIDGQQVPLAN